MNVTIMSKHEEKHDIAMLSMGPLKQYETNKLSNELQSQKCQQSFDDNSLSNLLHETRRQEKYYPQMKNLISDERKICTNLST